MSEYLEFRTEFKSRTALRKALVAAGIQFEECRPGEAEKNLYGYLGKKRAQTATFVWRRKHVGASSNDVGWHWNPTLRMYQEIVSEYDGGLATVTQKRKTLKKEYACVVATAKAKAKGYRTKRINNPDGSIRLQISGSI